MIMRYTETEKVGLIKITRKKFSFGWNRFSRNEVKKAWHKDSFSYLEFVPQDIFKGKSRVGLDVGCGSGSDLINISKFGARVIGIDLSDAISIAKDNAKEASGVFFAQANAYQLPFKDGIFDFVYSFGVLHHLPDPLSGFKAICSKVKKGGYVIVYLYEDFSKRSRIERGLLKMINSVRIVTKRMPPELLYFFCVLASPFILLSCSLPHQLLKKIKSTKNFANRIPYRHTCNLEIIVSDLYDRFSPPIEHRYSEDEVRDWFLGVDFEDVRIVNYRGWVAWGRKR